MGFVPSTHARINPPLDKIECINIYKYSALSRMGRRSSHQHSRLLRDPQAERESELLRFLFGSGNGIWRRFRLASQLNFPLPWPNERNSSSRTQATSTRGAASAN